MLYIKKLLIFLFSMFMCIVLSPLIFLLFVSGWILMNSVCMFDHDEDET